MSYTAEEIRTIRENYAKIKEYTLKEICSKLPEGESIRVSFGPDDMFLYGASADGKAWFMNGGLSFPLWKGADYNIYDSWTYGLPLLLNWATVKHRLLEQVRIKKDERQRILNFEV